MIRIIFPLAAMICASSQAIAASPAHPVPVTPAQQVQIITPPVLSIRPEFRRQPMTRGFPGDRAEALRVRPGSAVPRAPQSRRPVYRYIVPAYYPTEADYPYCRTGLFGRIANKPCRIRRYKSRGVFGRY